MIVAISEEKHQDIINRCKDGQSRNSIAKAVKSSTKTVTKVAMEAGLTFDRKDTIIATEAAQADAKSRRASLGLALLTDLETARLRLIKTNTARDFQATAQGLDALTRAYTNLLKLEPNDDGLSEVQGMMGVLLAAVRTSVSDVPTLNPIGGELIE